MSIFFIAEIGVNHNGNIEEAIRLIDAAKESGADAVKFQTYRADDLVTRSAEKASYQKENTSSSQSQFEMLKELELSKGDHFKLNEYSSQAGIEFMSSAFDVQSLHFLTEEIGIKKIKIPSGEITNSKLLLACGQSKKDIILSTGMSVLSEIDDALGVLAFGLTDGKNPSLKNFRSAYRSESGKEMLENKMTLLHCTTEYPTANDQVNLNVIETLRKRYQLKVGLSDHSVGNLASLVAIGMGVSVIEKHFTLDKSAIGPDHKASMEPEELKELVTLIKEVETILGSSEKLPTKGENDNASVARKSLVAQTRISKGERFSKENIEIKRPGNGISPMHYFDYLGKFSDIDYVQDDLINKIQDKTQ